MNCARTLRALLLAASLTSLAACGGGGGGATSGGDAPPPGTARTWVLVEVGDPDDVDDIARDTGATVLEQVAGTSFWRVQLPPGTTLEAFLAELDDDARVVDSSLDVGLAAPEGDGSTIPAGGLLLSSQIPTQPELLRIGLALASTRATGQGVRVAVVDTGLVPHPFLDANVDADGWDFVGQDADPTDERDFLDSDGDGLVDEGWGHGTFVASLIVALAPDVRIVPFRVLDSDALGNASTLAAAITMAADRGVDVINLSLGTRERLRVVEEAVKNAQARGVQVIASAGNTGLQDVNFPAALSEALSVTAVGANDVRADFASYGGEVDLSAPGVSLHGAYPSPMGTARWSGTSFSAALVTGAYALVREAFPAASRGDLVKRLEDGAVDVDALNPASAGRLGKGRLDLEASTGP